MPFGIPYMLFVVPIGGSISRGVGILALNAIIGALFGCVIAAVVLIKAAGYLVWWSFGSVIRLLTAECRQEKAGKAKAAAYT